jgi:hypothetical protein
VFGELAEAGVAQGHAGKLGEQRLCFMGVHHQPERAHAQQDRRGEGRGAVQPPGGDADPVEEGCGEQAAGQARRVMDGQQPAERLGEQGADPVVKRRKVAEGFAGELGNEPAATG